ncbi:hypothetical protein ACFL3S_00680 [Gemmatimonadota bacterium]
MTKGSGGRRVDEKEPAEVLQGIVVTDRSSDPATHGARPRIAAFIWGGKVRPTPTLPYGRWKGAA